MDVETEMDVECLRVKGKAEQPSHRKDLKDRSSRVTRDKNSRKISPGSCFQNDIVLTTCFPSRSSSW